jgi:hypothetical protein
MALHLLTFEDEQFSGRLSSAMTPFVILHDVTAPSIALSQPTNSNLPLSSRRFPARQRRPRYCIDSRRPTPILEPATAARLSSREHDGVYPLQQVSKMVKICLSGRCKHIGIIPVNGEPARCEIRLELDHNLSLAYHLYDIQLFVPVEFATLLEVGHTVTVTLEQNGD